MLLQQRHHYEVITLKTLLAWTTIKTSRGASVRPVSVSWSRELRAQLHPGHRNEPLFVLFSNLKWYLIISCFLVVYIHCVEFYAMKEISTKFQSTQTFIKEQRKQKNSRIGPWACLPSNVTLKNSKWQITMNRKLRNLRCHLPTGRIMVI